MQMLLVAMTVTQRKRISPSIRDTGIYMCVCVCVCVCNDSDAEEEDITFDQGYR
jgi:hypothetical protein